jgi:hypothetical protein
VWQLQTLSQGQLIERAKSFSQKAKLGIDDRVYVAAPLSTPDSHAAILGALMSGASSAIGATNVIATAEIDNVLRNAADEFSTVLQVTPEMLTAITNHSRLSSYKLSLKRVVVGMLWW